MSSLELPRCQRHPSAVAGWGCQSCAASLCPDCVATQALSLRTELDSCVLCGGTTRQLKVHRSRVSLLARLPQAFLFPFTRSALLSMVAVSAVTGALGWLFWSSVFIVFKAIAFIVWMGTFWTTMFHLIRLSARGEDDVGPPEFTEAYSDLFLPAVRGVVATSLIGAPAAWYVYKTFGWENPNPLLLAQDPILWLLLLVGVAYGPMALMVAAAGGGLLRILNPVLIFAYIARVGRDYALAVAALGVLFILRVLLGVVGVFVTKAPVPVVAGWVAELLALYAPFAMARVLGTLLHVRGDVLGYGMPEDYLEPVLRDEARGSLTFADGRRSGGAPSTSGEPAASNGIGAIMEAVRRAVDANDVDRAVELYASAPEFAPHQLRPTYHFAIGQGAATRGNYPLAVRALTAASEADPADPIAPRAFVVLARVYGERMNEPRKADAIYQFVIERYPGTSAAQFALTRMSPVKA